MDSAPGSEHHSQLWTCCRRGEAEARRKLVELHLPFAQSVAASHFARRLHDEIEFDDYVQLACVGLIECVDRFEPGAGVYFETFAARRVNGSLLDGLERMSEARQQAAANTRLRKLLASAQACDAARELTTARELGIERLLAHVASSGLAFALAWLLEGTGMLHQRGRSETIAFYDGVELRQLRDEIVALVEALPPQERRVVRDHYFQERPFLEIAESMRLTKGRISQIHHKALQRLREALVECADRKAARDGAAGL